MSTITARADYTSKDFDGLKASMLDYAAQVFPEWQSRSEGDFGVVLVELMAYMGDVLSYYTDRVQDEAYLSTATQRQSVLQIASLLGYLPSNGTPATGTVQMTTATGSANPVLVPQGTEVTTDYIDAYDGPLTFETTQDATLPAGGTSTVAVPVAHGVTRPMFTVATSNGLPGQQYRLPDISILTDTINVYVDSVNDGVVTQVAWARADYLVDGDPESQIFSTYVDSYGSTWIQFGDGLNGVTPTNGLNIWAEYRVGGGTVGNLAAGQITGLSGNIAGAFIANDVNNNPISSAMTGGTDPESNDQIRANAPRVFRTQNRMVTLADFEDAALAVPGVLRASAVAGSFSSVTIYCVGPDGSGPSAVLTSRLQASLSPKALAGTTITIASPSNVAVNLGLVTIQVLDRFKADTVRTQVQQAIQSFLSFANVDFGARITISDFYSLIRSVPGVQWVNIPLMARNDAAQTGTADIVCRDWEIPVLGSYTLNVLGGVQ